MKKQNRITLIALIITIVVLLILAVVAIGAVQESGIITHAQKAATDYNSAKADEESKIEGYEALIESKLPGGNDVSKVTYTDEGVPVPAGFKVVTGTKDTGLVIENETEGSQFVWVPVTTDIDANGYGLNTDDYREPDVITGVDPSETVDSASGTSYDAVSSNLERAGCTVDLNDDGVVNAYDFKIQLTNEYKAMVESVNKYDGFYVGRYETSMNGTNPQSKASTAENIIESATAEETSANTWYGLYALNKKYNTSSVKSSMIWGSQYDAMMNWMGAAANTTITEYNKERTCGTAPDDVIKNVYDSYGNSIEWTLEAVHADLRVVRGVDFYNSSTPSSRTNCNPTYTDSLFGSRLALYIV